MKTITVCSSHGEIIVDAETGRPVEWRLESDERDSIITLMGIQRFDLEEWKKFWQKDLIGAIDILDLGYWHRNVETGEKQYEDPVEGHREHIRAGMSSITL